MKYYEGKYEEATFVKTEGVSSDLKEMRSELAEGGECSLWKRCTHVIVLSQLVNNGPTRVRRGQPPWESGGSTLRGLYGTLEGGTRAAESQSAAGDKTSALVLK